MNNFFRYWLPVLAWMGIIFYFSSQERVSVSQEYVLNFVFFKTLHVLEYAFLYLLSYRALARSAWRKDAVFPYWLAFAVTIAYAVSDEWHQTMVPTREGKLRDVIIDASGALIAWIAIERILPRTGSGLRKLAARLDLT